MKKLVIMAALAVAAVSASAAEFSVYTKYDYDNLNSASNTSLSRGTIGVRAGFGNLGAVDVFAVTASASGLVESETDQGLGIGYRNGFKVGKLGVSGRVSYIHLSETSADVLRPSIEVTYPLTATIAGVAGIEHIRVNNDSVANRSILGADFAVTKKVSVRAVYAFTDFTGVQPHANGLTLAAAYKF